MQDEKAHHVHFEASDELAHDNNIVVKRIDVGKIDIHVGFLQVMHKYEVIVPIPTVFLPNSESIRPGENTNLFARYQVMFSTEMFKKSVGFTPNAGEFTFLPLRTFFIFLQRFSLF